MESHVIVDGCDNDCSDHHNPIDNRNVDMAVKLGGGVYEFNLGEI